MSSVNKVILIGRLGRDPEIRATSSGQQVANFSVATDESYKDRDGNKIEKTEWHSVVAWGNQAEFCGNYLSKGRLVYVEGKLETRKWQDKDGVDKYTTEVKADRVQGLDSKQAEGATQQARTQQPSGGGRKEHVDMGDAPF